MSLGSSFTPVGVRPRIPGPAASAAEAAVWHVRLLGGFEIDDGRHRLTRLRSRAAMALLARVASAPSRDHPREELAALLWPEADAETGRGRLRQTLSLLRAVLEPPGGPPVLQADRRVVRAVAGALWCDAQAFEQALRDGQRELAQALYVGDLLPGFYDEWVVDERHRLLALAERLGERLGEGAPANARAPGARPLPGLPPAGPPTSAPSSPPSAAAAPAAAARLPQYLTRLIGADQPGARLQALVAEHRLVSVLGPGGCGKTRLAVEVARLAAEPAPEQGGAAPRFDAALFVSLVGVAGRTGLLDRLLLALRLGGGGDAVEQLLSALEGRALLLVLDNAEQLDDEAAATVALLAERTPRVHWLVTSRRPLGLDGERSLVLETLAPPADGAALAEVAMNPAVALFVDRARAHRPDFHVGAGNRDALVALLRRLDGLPLAIELAASHVRTLGPAELLALLQAARSEPGGSLAFLARRGARSGSDPRHASMWAVVDWSWRLLDGDQQRLLSLLALLPSGAALHAAAALGRAPGTPGPTGTPGAPGTPGGAGRLPLAEAQSRLDALVAHSVLRVVTGQDGQLRYLPYEPVREFALAQGDAAAQRAGRGRVLDWLLDWARGLPATPPLPTVRDELPNLMQVLATAAADGRADDAVRLVLMLQSSWGEIAVPGGVLQALDGLLATPGLDDALAAGGHALAASRCQEAGRPDDARRHLAAALARPCSDPAQRIMVLSRGARVVWRLDRDHQRARAMIDEALPLAREHARPNSEASLLSLLAHLATVVDRDPARGTALSAEALALWQRSGNRHLVNAGRFNVATNRMKGGDHAGVLDEFAALAAEGRELQDWDLAAGALEARGTALLALRRWPEALADLRESVRVAWDGLEVMALAYALWNVAPVLARLRHAVLAAEVMGAAEALWRQRFGAFDDSDLRDLERVRRFARALLGPEGAAAAWQRGAARPLAEVVRAVLASR
ncbi:MAG: hypothetical protein KF683_09330 [Rubrivivax sp.]|nr:hypothetical protein [Rubrivivax sp.]